MCVITLSERGPSLDVRIWDVRFWYSCDIIFRLFNLSTDSPDYRLYPFVLAHWKAAFDKAWHESAIFQNRWLPFCQIWMIFTHLNVGITSARHNFKCVKIPSDSQQYVFFYYSDRYEYYYRVLIINQNTSIVYPAFLYYMAYQSLLSVNMIKPPKRNRYHLFLAWEFREFKILKFIGKWTY